jgi:hypothetical protein
MAISPDRAIDQTITNNLHRLSKYGVLTARPRYEITDHQLTGRRAIVATVHTKKPMAGLPRGEAPPHARGSAGTSVPAKVFKNPTFRVTPLLTPDKLPNTQNQRAR